MLNLAHHWLVSMRGGEKVLAEFSKLAPKATISTLVSDESCWEPWVKKHAIRNSLLQKLPSGPRRYKSLLPLFPSAVKRLTIPENTKLLLSSDASVIKGLRIPEGVPHVCYCHSPPRYLWDQQETYLKQTSGLGFVGRKVFESVAPFVRNFDRRAAQSVDHFIANSTFVSERIKNCYGKESVVIHPPVSVDDFRFNQPREDFYLIVSAMVPYKRVDIAIEAFNQLKKKLVVIGDGSEKERLENLAGPTVSVLGSQPFSELKRNYETCRAFIFPGIEDFGITPLESMASGAPVIAFAKGGALDTVVDDVTGVFFHKQSADCLADAVNDFESRSEFDPLACRRHAEKFAPEVFRKKIWDQLLAWYPFLQNKAEGWGIGPEHSTELKRDTSAQEMSTAI